MGVPINSPRRVSLIGVNGWYSANQRTAPGSESVGTNPLPSIGRNVNGNGMLLADSGLRAVSPIPADSHVNARINTNSKPTAANHSTGPAVGRNPIASANPTTNAILATV